jgi:P-type conjugative transfer protein TrbJ
MKAWSGLVLVAIGFFFSGASRAQFVVVDPANLIQNTLAVLRMVDEINNQIQQLANEAVMLENEAKNLKNLDFSTLNRLLDTLATIDSLIAQGRGLSYEVQQTIGQFEEQYPTEYGHGISNLKLAEDARVRWVNSLEALRTAVTVQSQAEHNMASDEGVLTDLVDRSQAAVGALQALQATNQLLALQVRQSVQFQQIQLAAARATAMEQARGVAAEERSHQVRRNFTSDKANYTPAPVGGFGNP